jgi:TetR/AcrR family fatty acid metabolism transcriptional regulator
MNEWSFIFVMPASARAIPRRPVRVPRPAGRGDKYDRILAAATRVFARHGFFGAQVADVASAADVAAGTVYLYFRGKDDLLVSIFEKTMASAIAEGRAALDGIDDPVERLRRIARMHLARLGSDRDLAVVFQVELRQTTKFMSRFSTTGLRDYLGLIRDVVTDGQKQGYFREGVNPTLVAKMIFGALDEMATNWVLSERTYDLASDADTVVDLFIHGLRAPAKPSGAARKTALA